MKNIRKHFSKVLIGILGIMTASPPEQIVSNLEKWLHLLGFSNFPDWMHTYWFSNTTRYLGWIMLSFVTLRIMHEFCKKRSKITNAILNGRSQYCLLTEVVDIIRELCAKKHVNPTYLYGDDITILNSKTNFSLVNTLSEPIKDIYLYILRECQKGNIVLYGEEIGSTCIFQIKQQLINLDRFSGDFHSLRNYSYSKVLYQKFFLSKISLIKLYFVVAKKIKSLKKENNPFLNFYVD